MATEIESTNGNHPQHWPISEQMVDYTNMGIRTGATKVQSVEREVTLEQSKVMMETVRGQIS
jgi:hypothetical protein